MLADKGPRSGFRWSYSTSRQLHLCPRQYQYGRDQAPAAGKPGSVSVHALVGLAVHEAVSAEIDEWSKNGPVDKNRAQKASETFIRSIWSQRRQRITELVNGVPETALPDLTYLLKAARGRLGRFFEMIWPTFSDYRHESHEQLAVLEVAGADVAIKIDFACWTKAGDLLIVDWKTGGAQNVEGGRTQLAVYALWAHRALGLDLVKIRPMVVSIATGERVEFAPTPMDVDAVEALVREDCSAVSEMNRAGMFPARPQFEQCLGCRFLPRCPEGSASVAVAYKLG
jgi:hypothetical protein